MMRFIDCLYGEPHVQKLIMNRESFYCLSDHVSVKI